MDWTLNKRWRYYQGVEQAAKQLITLEASCYSQEYIAEESRKLISDAEAGRDNCLAYPEGIDMAYFWQGFIDGIKMLLESKIPDLKAAPVVTDYPVPRLPK